MEIPPEQRDAIVQCLLKREKIAAVKICREATGCGLKEAKDAVEEIAKTIPELQDAKKQGDVEVKGGCFGLVIFLGAGLIASTFMILRW